MARFGQRATPTCISFGVGETKGLVSKALEDKLNPPALLAKTQSCVAAIRSCPVKASVMGRCVHQKGVMAVALGQDLGQQQEDV